MTTGARVTISEHSVRAALAEWKATREAAEREAADDKRVAGDRARVYARTPADYADDLTPYVFSLLQKHAEVER